MLETYLTIEGLAEYLKLSDQTIRKWVFNREVPYHKIRKVIRFRLSEIEEWVNSGGIPAAMAKSEVVEGGLFNETKDEEIENGGDAGQDGEA